jgi:hypothetical protein
LALNVRGIDVCNKQIGRVYHVGSNVTVKGVSVLLVGVPPAIKHTVSRNSGIQEGFVRERSHLVVLPSPSGISVEDADAAREDITSLGRIGKGKRFIGIRNRNVSADNRCHLMVGDASNKVKNRAWKVSARRVPMVSAVKTLVSSYRFIKTNLLLVGFACLISIPRAFM